MLSVSEMRDIHFERIRRDIRRYEEIMKVEEEEKKNQRVSRFDLIDINE